MLARGAMDGRAGLIAFLDMEFASGLKYLYHGKFMRGL